MDIEVLSATISDKPIIRQMLELFKHDLSEFENTDLDEHGHFGYPYLDYYWGEANRYPSLIRVNGKLAGFVLVNQYTSLPDSQYSVAEFFILRKYRKCGIGRQVAVYIFDRFCGRWEIRRVQTNIIAQQFWHSVIGAYTDGNYTETVFQDKEQICVLQCFDNTHNRSVGTN